MIHNLVYFSVMGNTSRLVNKLSLNNNHINDGVGSNSVLVIPTYGVHAVPNQVIKALNKDARKNVIGVIGTGNINFGKNYCLSGTVLSAKLQVPLLYRVELAGTPWDIEQIENIFESFNSRALIKDKV